MFPADCPVYSHETNDYCMTTVDCCVESPIYHGYEVGIWAISIKVYRKEVSGWRHIIAVNMD